PAPLPPTLFVGGRGWGRRLKNPPLPNPLLQQKTLEERGVVTNKKGKDMSLAIVYSRASSGISAPLVTVETHLSYGMVGFHIVGLPETAVKESRHRVRSALMNMHFEFPLKRITVNLAPADLPKEGGRFDLPIALGILAASQQIPTESLKEYEFSGELALSG